MITAAVMVHAVALDVREAALALDAAAKHASRCYLTNPDLLWPRDACFQAVRNAGNDMAFIHLLRVDIPTFNAIVASADPTWLAHMAGFADMNQQQLRVGRPTRLDGPALIALALVWLATPAQQKFLQLVFGAGPAVVSRGLRLGLRHLLGALRAMPETDIRWPTPRQMRRYAAAIKRKYGEPPIAGVNPWGFVDGVRFYINDPNDITIQELYYNGHVRRCNINNILVFTPDGRCVYASLCHQGNQGDYRCSLALFMKLRDRRQTPLGFGLMADAAFASHATNTFMYTETYLDGTDQPLSAAALAAWKRWWGPPRKSAEFGIRIVTSLWRRLLINLPSMPENHTFNMELLEVALRMNNLIASRMDHHNQLKTMYGVAQMNDVEGNAEQAQNEWPVGGN
jgi:hypothetical protein